MKKLLIFLSCLLIAISSVFAFSYDQIELAHNPEFAIYQRLQLDTIRARSNSKNRAYLSELAFADLLPSYSDINLDYYSNLNEQIHKLELLNTQRERLDFLLKENKKGALTALVPNALSIATVALSSGSPKKAIIATAGMALSSIANYTNERTRVNLEYIQKNWELDDLEKESLKELGQEIYQKKSEMARELDIEPELTLSTKDLEAFVIYSSEPDAKMRFIKLSQLNKRLEILPEYWSSLASTAYDLGNYEDALLYIDIFENIFVPVVYHDTQYAQLLMIKADCISKITDYDNKYAILEEIADTLLEHIEFDDNAGMLYAMTLYMDIFRATNDKNMLIKVYDLFPAIIAENCKSYKSALYNYLNGSYISSTEAEFKTRIDQANQNVVHATTQLKKAKDEFGKKGTAYEIRLEEKEKAEEEKKKLETDLKNFKNSSNTILPPSCDFLCALMNKYIEISTYLGKIYTPEYRNTCAIFIDAISQDYKLMSYYSNFNYLGTEYNIPNATYDFESKNTAATYYTFGIKKKETIKVKFPISYLYFPADYSSQILDEDDLLIEVIIDKHDCFELTPISVSIEPVNDLGSTFMSINIQNQNKYQLTSLKPNKDEEVIHEISLKISSKEDKFIGNEINIAPGTDLYEEIVSNIKYSKE